MEVGIIQRRPRRRRRASLFVLLFASFGLGATGYHWSQRQVRRQDIDQAIAALRMSPDEETRRGALLVLNDAAEQIVHALREARAFPGDSSQDAQNYLKHIARQATR